MGRKKQSVGEVKLDFNLSTSTLDTFIQYIFTKNKKINKESLMNMCQLLFDKLDLNFYKSSPEIYARIIFINKALKSILSKKVSDLNLIIETASVGKYREYIINTIYPELKLRLSDSPISDEKVVYLNKYISELLKYANVVNESKISSHLLEKINSNDFDNMEDIIKDIESQSQRVLLAIRKIKTEDENIPFIDFSPNSFKTASDIIVEELNKPSRFIKTGIQCLNELMGGGLESRRFYLIMGAFGGYKSGLLLSLAKWAVDHNKGFKCKNPDARPCVLYLTQENSYVETFERLFKMTFNENIKKYTSKEVYGKFKEKGYFSKENINLRIVFKPSKSISVGDLDVMIDKIEEDGNNEVILVIQDYIKRIKSTTYYPGKERWLELADVVDDLNTIAKTREIPVVSAMQLNREAIKIIEQMNTMDKDEDVKKLNQKIGGSSISESLGIMENSDWSAVINLHEKDGKLYLWIRRLKKRYECSQWELFIHPFDESNNLRLKVDIDLTESLSRKDIRDEKEILNNINGGGNPRKKPGTTSKGTVGTNKMLFDDEYED